MSVHEISQAAPAPAPRRTRPRRENAGRRPPVSSVRRQSRAGRAASFAALTAGSVVFAYPFLWMIATSLRTRQGVASGGVSLWPVQWAFGNYAQGLGSFPFWRYLGNSLLTTLIPVAGTVLVSSLAGFAFARIPARGRGVLFAVVLGTMLLPAEITIVPQFVLFRELGMVNTLYPLILPYVFGSPFFIFLFRQFYLRLPGALTDAAIIDGAGWLRTWWSIYLPLSKPILIASAVLQFMASWNNFLAPAIYISNDRLKTLPLALAGFTSVNGTDMPLLLATTIVVVLPCVVIFFAAQRHIIGGISFTGTK
ncbi:carbohydrate ABC transporter permease [Streptomyces gilvus]|uniref:carbohydrate ABC transporter permease n=1 Tax=Streptomyces gilvus TaxID=2920937 RepID=UPI001F0D79FB|nr:carbohydrate ABC transporter permease [Streptomyces sp. CME 23]MCH5672450.1 carbohydrate ABC transporter permease [Streptomyces sp. CME 23]